MEGNIIFSVLVQKQWNFRLFCGNFRNVFKSSWCMKSKMASNTVYKSLTDVLDDITVETDSEIDSNESLLSSEPESGDDFEINDNLHVED